MFIVLPAPASADIGEVVVPAGEHWTWEDDSKDLTGIMISVQGTLTVRDYQFFYNISADGEASIRVMDGGLLEFENVTLLSGNSTGRFLFRVEGRFVADGAEIDNLIGDFATGGGIKCMNGEVELVDTYIHDCEVQGIYLEGAKAKATLDNCRLDTMEYGVHVKGGGKVTLRNGCEINQTTKAALLINRGEADVSNTTIMCERTTDSQGIAVRDGELRVTNSIIYDCKREGIELVEETLAYLTNVEIYNCTVGVRLSGLASADIWSCNIHDCLDGLNMFLSGGVIRQCHITGNYNGIASKDCTDGYEVRGCTIGGNSQYGIYAIGKGLSESGTVWKDVDDEPNAIARIIQWWTLDVNVTDQGDPPNPIANAEVTVNAVNGTQLFTGITNALGSVADIELEGWRVENDGTNTTQGAYNVRVEEGERWAERDVTMDTNIELTVQLGEAPSITDSPFFWAVPVALMVIAIALVGYWWRYIR